MEVVVLVATLAVGVAGGYGGSVYYAKRKTDTAEAKAKSLIKEAQAKAQELTLAAKEQALRTAEEAKTEEKERRRQMTEIENRISQRETALDRKLEELDKRSESLRKSETSLEELKDDLRKLRTKQQESLEKIAKLSKDEARDKLMQMVEKDTKADLTGLIAKLQTEAVDTADDQATMVLVTAMERMASDQASERTVTTVALPSDELKGRVIGKEGRNIQTIERLTGVDVLVDDTPGVIVLSSFDPIRRQIARVTLEKLLADGRIHPARIEEVVKKAESEIDKVVKEAGEAAVKEAGVVGLHPELIKLLGQLRFRTSYSQNVLKHSVEMAQLATTIAQEVGADIRVVKTASLLHDLGKAVTHEIEGQHHHISRDMAAKYGQDEAVCHAIEAHHDDIEATTPEAIIVRIVDALSGGRPGARGDTMENYVKRMTELENLANTFPGIQKSYAVSAGRELRVLVVPEEIDDLSAIKLARDLATKIEATLKYPGVIKVNIIRETRAIEYAK
ncbi:MAG TPA: ribonuclease Y [Candidatus Polarisedimenticolaceae bacterium]|nr:ribonuclease Y [Candidatus Polarisedimenticolaceae bacterium]